MIDSCCVPMGVTALACAIADQVPNDNELNVLAQVFTVLGDQLALIAAQRLLSENNKSCE